MFSINNRRNRSKHAFTLTELAIVLGVVGTLLSGIWAAATVVNANSKNNLANKEIMAIAQNVRALYSIKSSIMSGDLTSNFITAGVFPSNMVLGSSVINPWGTTNGTTGNGVDVGANWGPACSGDSSGTNFGLVYWGVPKTACISILMYMTGPNAGPTGVNCAYGDGVGTVALDGSSESAIQSNCVNGGNVAIGFNLK